MRRRGISRISVAAALAAVLTLLACSPSAGDGPGASGTPSASPTGPCPGHPTPACTGVPPGTRLRTLPLTEKGVYRVTTPGAVLDRVHIAGDLLITAKDVKISNSQIDGSVLDSYAGKTYSFTITDSTVGTTGKCETLPGVGDTDYTAVRVHIRGHGDGFRDSGDNIVIRDSYVHLCSNPGDHSDGIQTYVAGKGLLFHHNTVDQRDAKDITAPIFITDPHTSDVTVTDNLIMGGTYSIQVRNVRGRAVVRDNKLVDKSWVYGPVDSDCDAIEWSGNTLVTIDGDYRITSTVGPLDCAG
ncbi:MAG: right-handed parallel beta-helix repeat-containing protein [Microbispora sp.]|nr:right-handed parallel beta-helix repeat-containing protein [Microbispora sp.]